MRVDSVRGVASTGSVVRAAAAGAFALLWLGGAATYVGLAPRPPRTEWAAPAFLVLAAALCVGAVPARQRWRLCAAGAVGWVSEVVGVATGWPFGAYEYTDELGVALWGVPLALWAAWLALTAYATHLASLAGSRSAAGWMLATCALVAADLLIDPVAAGDLAFWQWQQAGSYYGVPVSNFAGWLLVGALAVAIAGLPERPARGVLTVGAAVLAFFIVIALALGLVMPVLLGALPLCGHVAGAIGRRSTQP